MKKFILFLFIIFTILCQAQNTKISALSSGAPSQSTDKTVIARAGANYSLTIQDILDAIPSLEPNVALLNAVSNTFTGNIIVNGPVTAPSFTGTSATPVLDLATWAVTAPSAGNSRFGSLTGDVPAVATNALGVKPVVVAPGTATVTIPGANGLMACTGTACSTTNARTLTAGNAATAVSNGDGVSGNPTVSVVPTQDKQDTTALTLTGGEDTVFTTTLAAGALASGRCLMVEWASGRNSGSGGLVFKIYYGATSFAYASTATSGDPFWPTKPTLICNNAGSTAAQRIIAPPIVNFANSLLSNGGMATPAETSTNAIVVKLTVTGTAGDKINRYAWVIWSLP